MAKKTEAVKILRPAVKKPAAKPAAPKKTRLEVSVDYPLEGESVRSGHYSIRLTSAGAGQVQVRLDGEWTDCREAVGHFWYDWSPLAGSVRIEARARVGKGRWTAASPRACVVES
ncbi:MAG: hypothetical protein ACHQ51_04530 [Elusimicrobiota bacterium]